MRKSKRLLQRINTAVNNMVMRLFSDFQPHIPLEIDQRKLQADIADYFSMDLHTINELFVKYQLLHSQKAYTRELGEFKTLSFEEAFIVLTALQYFRPKTIVEIGTQYGKSTRKIVDMVSWLGLASHMICYDIEDQRRYISEDEAKLILKDLTGGFRGEVLTTLSPELIFLDARPYHLIKEVISEFLAEGNDCILLIHDCSEGLCNPNLDLPKDEPERVSSFTGVWERLVLAEIFGIADPLSPKLNDLRKETHHLRVFDTQHGLAAIRALE